VVARTHKTLIWERTRHPQGVRHALRDSFPAAVPAFQALDAPDALELLAKAPDPASAARLTRTQLRTALKRAEAATSPPRPSGSGPCRTPSTWANPRS
jgi:hypothetical protein